MTFLQVMMIAAGLSCCATRPPEIVTRDSEFDRSPKSGRYQREGDTLVIRPENQPGVWLAGAEVEVIDGDVYLDPINFSSSGPREVEIDLSGPAIPADWSERLFWITNAEYDPLKLFRRTRIYRRPITLDD